MKVIGKMTYSMVKEKKHGLMDQCMRDNTSRVKSMDLVFTAGMTAQDMKVNGLRIKLEA